MISCAAVTLKDLPALLGTHEALPPCPGAPGAGQGHKTHAGQLLPCQAAALPAAGGTGDAQLTAGDPPGSASPQAAPPGEAAAGKCDSD